MDYYLLTLVTVQNMHLGGFSHLFSQQGHHCSDSPGHVLDIKMLMAGVVADNGGSAPDGVLQRERAACCGKHSICYLWESRPNEGFRRLCNDFKIVLYQLQVFLVIFRFGAKKLLQGDSFSAFEFAPVTCVLRDGTAHSE